MLQPRGDAAGPRRCADHPRRRTGDRVRWARLFLRKRTARRAGGLLCETIPACERVRFTGSGTEATMHCLRLARAFTGRTKILKFEGQLPRLPRPGDVRHRHAGRPPGPGRRRRRPVPGSTGHAAGPGGAPRPRAVQPARPARRGVSPARPRAGRRHLRADLLQRRLHHADAGVPAPRCAD